MKTLEDRLTQALADTANTVREDGLRPLTAPARPRRRWSWAIAPAAAAATVAVILGIEAGVVRMNGSQQASHGPVPADLTVRLPGSPSGLALDAANGTLYVTASQSAGRRAPGAHNGVLAMVSASACNASTSQGCGHIRTASTGGAYPGDVVVDDRTQTVYVLNAGSLAVINAATCNAATGRGCGAKPALVTVPAGVGDLAVNPRTDTVYLLNEQRGSLSVVNGKTCNAASTLGCRVLEAAPSPGSARFFGLWVDAATNTLYLQTQRGLAVVDGRTCNGTDIRGCGQVLATVQTDGDPVGFAVDESSGSIYVSGTLGKVSIFNRNTCSTRDTSDCAGPPVLIGGGPLPIRSAADQRTRTIYVVNESGVGPPTVSMLDAARCNARGVVDCPQFPVSFPVGALPGEILVAPHAHTVYVGTGHSLSVINAATCNAADTRGCPTQPPPGTRVAPETPYTCDLGTTSEVSGTPAGPLIKVSVRVAAGSAGGQAWSLWAKKGVFYPNGIEQGGLVLNGRWYPVCDDEISAGANGNLQLVDAGARGVVFGYVQHPRPVRIRLAAPGVPRWSPTSVRLPGTTFYLSRLPRSACSYRSISVKADATKGPAWSGSSNITFGTCLPNQFVPLVRGHSSWGPGAGN